MNRRLIILFVLVGVAAAVLLAFPLRTLVQDRVILPMMSFFWNLGRIYRAIPQIVFWVIFIVILIFIMIGSFFPVNSRERRLKENSYYHHGNVQRLAFWIESGQRSIYSRWHVARLLAELALDLLNRRGEENVRQARWLGGSGWSPPQDVQEYLDTALRTNYADYPRPKPFQARLHTPIDRDPEPIIEYLESLMEDEHDSKHT